MDNLLAARWMMALSLGFHIVLACLGIGLPLLIFVAHRRGLRGERAALELAKRWSRAAAVLFAIGAISGTVLSFEMGLLWPGFMGRFGDVIGLPFVLEGLFFFIEAIFLGIYLYGWRGLPARVHLATLAPVLLSGVLGTLCVLAVNGWMNDPAGFDLAHYRMTGEVRGVEPLAPFLRGSTWMQFAHMLPAAFVVTGFVVGAVHAHGWLRGRRDRVHELGATIGFTIAALALPVQLLTGDLAARHVSVAQPVKFAAMELLAETTRGAPLTLGGVLIDGEKRFAIELPHLTSILQDLDPHSEIAGLDAVPVDARPPANVVHLAFQGMVGIGVLLTCFAALSGWTRWRRGALPSGRWWWRALVVAGPASVLALELGWVTTEVGRQPWIAQDVLRVADAVTPRTGIAWALAVIVALYSALGCTAALVLRQMASRWRAGERTPAPYAPPEAG